VRDKNGEGHALLTVRTNHGDYILDNMNNNVTPWTATGYRFVKRQAQNEQNVWLDIADAGSQNRQVVSR
jgi:predicted transglutaminase-like cysteine proteinase